LGFPAGLPTRHINYLGASAVVFEGVTDPGYLEVMACIESLALSDDLNIGPLKVA
jgi:hypothetical protein